MIRRRAFLVVFGLIAVSATLVAASEGDAIVGVWLTAPSDEGRAHVEISKEGSTYAGKVIWLEQPIYPADDDQGMGGQSKVDRENPDPSLRQRPIIGLEMLEGFEYAGDGLWKDGTIYDPENGKTYKCKVRLQGATLKVRGYIGFSLIGRTSEWTRVADSE